MRVNKLCLGLDQHGMLHAARFTDKQEIPILVTWFDLAFDLTSTFYIQCKYAITRSMRQFPQTEIIMTDTK